jgi:branched-chain amino acid transport system ATP-binding protein
MSFHWPLWYALLARSDPTDVSQPETSVPALELRDVRKSFGGIRAVDGMSLRVGVGDRVAVIGPNGAGKSTLFGLISGELRADAGDVLLEGRSVRNVPPARRAKWGLGRTFQTARLFSGLSVRENVELAQVAAGRGGEGVRDALAEVSLGDKGEREAGVLAQGERKRLELAMVLAGEPRVLLLDEPTAGMGREERAAIMELVVGAVARRGLTMVFSEHDVDTVFAHARRVVVMDRGRPIADGTPEAVREDERVRRVYLGGGEVSIGGMPEVESGD